MAIGVLEATGNTHVTQDSDGITHDVLHHVGESCLTLEAVPDGSEIEVLSTSAVGTTSHIPGDESFQISCRLRSVSPTSRIWRRSDDSTGSMEHISGTSKYVWGARSTACHTVWFVPKMWISPLVSDQTGKILGPIWNSGTSVDFVPCSRPQEGHIWKSASVAWAVPETCDHVWHENTSTFLQRQSCQSHHVLLKHR